jgi:hypothetical protein
LSEKIDGGYIDLLNMRTNSFEGNGEEPNGRSKLQKPWINMANNGAINSVQNGQR